VEQLFARPATTTMAALQTAGFSPAMVQSFFRPFLAGVFLDEKLETSSRMFEFVFRMFAAGATALPNRGMGSIPAQLAEGLPDGTVRLHSRVSAIREESVELSTGALLEARAVIVATEGVEAQRLVPGVSYAGSRCTTCVYFAADQSPLDEPMLILDGEGRGPVTNLCVLSSVAPGYAPPGAALVSATVLGALETDTERQRTAVLEQMREWFGSSVRRWRHLRTYQLPHALPLQPPITDAQPTPFVRHGKTLVACGDYFGNASIEGALVSGRLAAEETLKVLS
jgi:phytoene dehydrogenase-like protein